MAFDSTGSRDFRSCKISHIPRSTESQRFSSPHRGSGFLVLPIRIGPGKGMNAAQVRKNK